MEGSVALFMVDKLSVSMVVIKSMWKWLLIGSTLLYGCIDFHLEPEKISHEFKDERWTPQSEVMIADSSPIHMVYIDRGKDNLAVFVHGSPGSWSAFVDFFKIDSLLEFYDMVAVDRPGYGQSDFGVPEPSLERQAYLIHAALSTFTHPNKVLVGHSLGGPVVARMAMDYPDFVSALILVAPSIDPEQEKYEWYRDWMQTKVGGWLTPTAFWVSNEEILPLKSELQLMLPAWQQLSIPTIAIHGKEDRLVPWENSDFASKMIPEEWVEVRYLEDANHFIPWTHPEAIVSALLDSGN